MKRVARWLVVGLAVLTAIVFAQTQHGKSTNMNSKEEALLFITELVKSPLSLKAVKCPPPGKVKSDVACFGTQITVDDFREQVDKLTPSQLQPVTGWRDDFGVMSAKFYLNQNKNYEVGLIYTRRGFAWDIYREEYEPLKEDLGLVSLVVEEH